LGVERFTLNVRRFVGTPAGILQGHLARESRPWFTVPEMASCLPMHRVIAHLDMDAFFASVWRAFPASF
jgi:hypothetical protein